MWVLCNILLVLLAYSTGAQALGSPSSSAATAPSTPASTQAAQAPAASTAAHSDAECRIISGPSALGAQLLLLGERAPPGLRWWRAPPHPNSAHPSLACGSHMHTHILTHKGSAPVAVALARIPELCNGIGHRRRVRAAPHAADGETWRPQLTAPPPPPHEPIPLMRCSHCHIGAAFKAASGAAAESLECVAPRR